MSNQPTKRGADRDANLAHLASFPELNPNPIIELDLAGNPTYINPATNSLFPDIQKEGCNHPFLADWQALIGKLKGKKQKTISREIKVGNVWYAQSIFEVPTSQTIRIYGRDITEKKNTEDALLKAHEELEMRVQERTLELTEANKALWAEIGQRKQAEAALKAEQEQFRDVLDMLPAYLVLLSPDYRVPFANRFFRERFGESHGRRCFEYLFDRTEPCEVCETYKVLKTGKPLEWEWTGPDGRNYYIFDFPFTGTDGATLIMEVGIDITEQKQTQAALRQAHDELELRVQERTRELSRSNAELEQFAYVASHDLQEPLRMVSSYVELLARRYHGKLDQDADDFIRYARDGALRMQRLISDLLAYSRVGTRSQDFEEVSLEDAYGQAVDNLKIALKNSEAVLTHDSLPVVTGDVGQLTQLFQNLVDNAIKFCGDGPPRIHISAQVKGRECVCSVRDEGIGIGPEFRERIFLLFQRLHPRGRYPGTGIGLAICKKIVETHGGAIWVESEPGVGSTFYFSLPAAERKE